MKYVALAIIGVGDWIQTGALGVQSAGKRVEHFGWRLYPMPWLECDKESASQRRPGWGKRGERQHSRRAA